MTFAVPHSQRLPLAIGAPIFVHAVFAKLLRVPLADGILPAFW